MIVLAARILLLVIVMAILIALTEGKRAHRIGVTLLAAWSIAGIVLDLLLVAGDPLPVWISTEQYRSMGLALGAWALWDVSRLTRLYGTTTLLAAAEVARGILLSPRTESALWAKWAEGLPKAAWIKGPDGVMLAINRHYETQYGRSRSEYAGARDAEHWGEDIAARFVGADSDVFRLGIPVVCREPAPLWNQPERESMFLKFPVRDGRGQTVGVGGIELVYESRQDEHERGLQM